VNNPLLVRMLNSLAHGDEQPQSIFEVEPVAVAEFRDGNTRDEFKDEMGPPVVGGAGVMDLRDVGMIHHGQGLALAFEPGDDLARIHAQGF
jgi:hypothetical protein